MKINEKYLNSLPTLSQSMIDTLRFFQVKRVYGIGGDFAVNLIKTFEHSFDLLPSSNEMHAAFSACGQAEVEGLGLCMTTYTVGSLPCSSAAALAKSEKLPVIFISGAPGEDEVSSTAIHHTVTSSSSWNVDYDAALNSFRGLGMRAERLQGQRSPGQPGLAGEQFFQLVLHAYMNNEPVFIEVPRDIVFAPTQSIQLPSSIQEATASNISYNSTDIIVEEIVANLAQSKAPLLYFGEGIKLNKVLQKTILTFCERTNIPFVATWFAKGIFADNHPLSLSAYNGVFTEPSKRHYVDKKADYVLEVATSITKMDANTAYGTGTHLLSDFKNKTVLNGTARLQQDLQEVFNKLLLANIIPFPAFEKEVVQEQIADEEKVDFHNVVQVLNEVQQNTDKAFVYMPEIGNSYFASYSLLTKSSGLGRSWICNAWYGAMGTSMPYARAVCEVLKERKLNDVAVVMTGDGGFHFQLNELIHFMQHELNVIIIWVNIILVCYNIFD
jgi:indolepyruvate decarboxylase